MSDSLAPETPLPPDPTRDDVRAPYDSPELKDLGDVGQLTESSGGGSVNDGGYT
jgi:hypothetical protein